MSEITLGATDHVYRKIIKVFLSSPGDLEVERRAAKFIVNEENANHANVLGFHIHLVGWYHSLDDISFNLCHLPCKINWRRIVQ